MGFTYYDRDSGSLKVVNNSEGQYLEHFGTKGMKWGQRRFQNEDGSLTTLGKERYGKGGTRSARKTKWDLNKLDREHTNAVANRDEIQSWVNRKIYKATKRAKKRGEPVQLSDRVKKYADKAKDYDKLIKRNEALTDRIIKESLKKGYSIKSRDMMRSVNKGKNAAASILATTAGLGLGALTGVGVVATSSQFAKGKHYKVKNDGLGIRTHKSNGTASTRATVVSPYKARKKHNH